MPNHAAGAGPPGWAGPPGRRAAGAGPREPGRRYNRNPQATIVMPMAVVIFKPVCWSGRAGSVDCADCIRLMALAAYAVLNGWEG